jgi:hypothetical protein
MKEGCVIGEFTKITPELNVVGTQEIENDTYESECVKCVFFCVFYNGGKNEHGTKNNYTNY